MAKSSTSFKKGSSGNPTGRPKVLEHVRDLAREHTVEAIEKLVTIMRGEQPAPALGAAAQILDRGWGKPAQTQEHTINDKRDVRDWTTPELIAFLNKHRESDDRADQAPKGARPVAEQISRHQPTASLYRACFQSPYQPLSFWLNAFLAFAVHP